MSESAPPQGDATRPDAEPASPRVFRLMGLDGTKPLIGDGRSSLGLCARVPGSSNRPDILPDGSGDVRPGTGGISVSPTLKSLLDRLPARLVPVRYRPIAPKASGDDKNCVWVMGQGPFVRGRLSSSLQLRPDPGDEDHGFIEPDATMKLQQYQSALIATRDEWSAITGN